MANPTVLNLVTKSLGRRSRKQIKKLKKGKGKLVPKAARQIQKAIDALGDDADGTTILPVVIIVEREPKRPWPWDMIKY